MKEFVSLLQRGEVVFPPLKLAFEKSATKPTNNRFIDAVLRLNWQKNTFRFAAEYKQLSNPKTVGTAIDQVRQLAQDAKLLPLVVVPFLDEESIGTLESQSVSGIDLCGNGVIIVPGTWYVRRTGNPNLFSAEGTIKNVYRKNSSVVARLFLARGEFVSVQDALDELVRRGGRVTLSTVSKVCKRLEEELIIERKRDGMTKLRLLQPEKLLDRLSTNYSPPRVTKRLAGKLNGIEPLEFRQQFRKWAKKTGNQVSLTGASSIGAYAVMARSDAEEYYCTDVAGAVRSLGNRFLPSERFATVTLLETQDEEVYFDRREDLTASPVETFLSLSNGDKRDQETAGQVRKVVLQLRSPLVAK